MKGALRTFAALALLMTCSRWASAQSDVEPVIVRVAFTNWYSWSDVRENKDSEVRFFETYLNRLQDASGTPKGLAHPVRFQITLGNYYQVLAWMKAGQVDAAVATPLVATLLERDGIAFPSVELTGGHEGYIPVIGARGPGEDNPIQAYEAYLARVLTLSVEKTPNAEALSQLRSTTRIHFVSHLSASGFGIPLFYAQQWLGAQTPRVVAEVQDRFWKTLLDAGYFELFHPAGGPASTDGTTDVYFSYCSALDLGRCKTEPAVWRPYDVERNLRNSTEAPVVERAIPNDVFIIRPDVAQAIQWPRTVPEIRDKLVRPASGISKNNNIQPMRPIVQSRFRERVLGMFFPPAAEQRYLTRAATQWFEEGRFAFTIEETLNFLRQDQRNSRVPQLSLVLSGGGVKSLYQAELLNHLYAPEASRPELKNFTKDPGNKNDETLVVQSIIGTSGGAILAFFAAQLPNLPNTLTELMGAMAARNVFPRLGLPRVVSLLALLTLFLVAMLIARTFSLTYRDLSKPVDKGAPLRLFHACVLVFVGGVIALRIVRGYNFEYVSVFEGLLFFATAVVLHLVTTCAVQADAVHRPRAVIEGWITILFGVTVVVAAVAVALTFEGTQSYERSRGPIFLSALVSAGVLVTALGIARLVSGGAGGLQLRHLTDYFKGISLLTLFLVVCYSLLIAFAQFRGSLLEVTGIFWTALLVCGSLVAAVLLLALHKPSPLPVPAFLRTGLAALMRDRVRGVTTTMMVTLVLAGAQGVALWILLIAPAVYGNEWALRAIRTAVAEEHLSRTGFNANLVVTGALLTREDCGSPETNLTPGGLYMCFEGGPRCQTATGRNWRVFRRPNANRAIDAVFASGSPFPMFPRHLAHTPDGCAIRLIDGGYAHNVPLDAARSLGGRQVLIINASPEEVTEEEDTVQITGQLVRESPRLLSFMFDRAQALDRSAGGTLLVASLGPHFDKGEEPAWPFLLDFRPEARKLVREQAQRDIGNRRRIGRINHWGLPVFVDVRSGR